MAVAVAAALVFLVLFVTAVFTLSALRRYWWSQSLAVVNDGSTDALHEVAHEAEADDIITEMSIGILDRLPDDALIMIMAEMYERHVEDLCVWQARKDLRRRARIDVRSQPSVAKCYWEELTPLEQMAARALGYDETGDSWDTGMMTLAVRQPWATLSPIQFFAAWVLGYSPTSWDSELLASDIDMAWVLDSEGRISQALQPLNFADSSES